MFAQDRLLQSFADQFEPDGEGFLYRRNQRRAPIRVTAAERQAFISDFARGVQTLWRLVVLAIVISILAMVALEIGFGKVSEDYISYVLIPAAFIVYLVASRHYWNAPYRALSARAAIGNERTRSEVGNIALAKMSWGQVALGVLGTTLLLGREATEQDLTVGWNRLWLFGALMLYALFARQAFRKWRLGVGTLDTSAIEEAVPDDLPRPSWFWIARGVFAGLVASSILGLWMSALVFNALKLAAGSTPKAVSVANQSATAWVLLFIAFGASVGVGQGIGAVVARWAKTAWVVAVFNAAFFFRLYWLSDKKPQFLILVVLPLVTASFVWRNPFVHRKIAERQRLARLISPR